MWNKEINVSSSTIIYEAENAVIPAGKQALRYTFHYKSDTFLDVFILCVYLKFQFSLFPEIIKRGREYNCF